MQSESLNKRNNLEQESYPQKRWGNLARDFSLGDDLAAVFGAFPVNGCQRRA
jgi:hypothetical protein